MLKACKKKNLHVILHMSKALIGNLPLVHAKIEAIGFVLVGFPC